MNQALYIVFLITDLLLIKECFCDSRKQECDAWNGLIEKTRSESRVNLNCQRNPNCTGIDCDGLYSYQGPFSGFRQLEVDFCVGIFLDTCHKPVQLYLYSEIPGRGSSQDVTVTHSDDFMIPNATWGLKGIHLTWSTYVHVTMENVSYNGTDYARIGVRIQVKVTNPLPIGDRYLWPNALQRQIIPITDIPIPKDCIPVPKHPKFTCSKYKPTTIRPLITNTTPGAPITDVARLTTTEMIPSLSSATYGKLCGDHGEVSKCESDEACVMQMTNHSECECKEGYKFQIKMQGSSRIGRCYPHAHESTYNQICNRKRVCSKTETCLFKNTMDTNGTCQCLPNLEYNYHTGCVSPSFGSAKGLPDDDHGGKHHSHPSHPVGPKASGQDGQKQGMDTKTIIIAVSVTAGVLFLATLLGIVIHKYLKFKRQYGGHQILMQEEDVVI